VESVRVKVNEGKIWGVPQEKGDAGDWTWGPASKKKKKRRRYLARLGERSHGEIQKTACSARRLRKNAQRNDYLCSLKRGEGNTQIPPEKREGVTRGKFHRIPEKGE